MELQTSLNNLLKSNSNKNKSENTIKTKSENKIEKPKRKTKKELLEERNQKILLLAYTELYPDKNIPKLTLKYSNKFSEFNGNVKYQKMGREIISLDFALSKKFIDCEDDIVIGIIQELLNKVFKTKVKTLSQDLYYNFTKHVGKYSKKKENEFSLKELFDEINKEYFFNTLEEPTIVFGQNSYRTLGHYNYQKDTITISTIFLDNEGNFVDKNLIKYVLYHEMLHKKHKFRKTNVNNLHHTKEFKFDEKKYEDKDIEKKLKMFVSKYKLKKEINKINPLNKIKKKFFRFF